MGFGVWSVSGRSRVPLPPARRMAFMATRDHTRSATIGPRPTSSPRRFWAANEPAELTHPGAHRPGSAARRGAADLVPGPPGPGPAQGDGGGADLRRRLADGLAGRLSGAAPQADHGARPAPR